MSIETDDEFERRIRDLHPVSQAFARGLRAGLLVSRRQQRKLPRDFVQVSELVWRCLAFQFLDQAIDRVACRSWRQGGIGFEQPDEDGVGLGLRNQRPGDHVEYVRLGRHECLVGCGFDTCTFAGVVTSGRVGATA